LTKMSVDFRHSFCHSKKKKKDLFSYCLVFDYGRLRCN